MRYQVIVERNGCPILVGHIQGENADSAAFQYDPSYLADAKAAAISRSLPLQHNLFSPAQTQNYFDGLLPEGFTRRTVASWMRVDESDYLSILHGLGRECLGAIQITQEGENSAAEYEKLSLEQVRALAAEGASKSAELVTKAHLSLTGASGKVGLYFHPQDNSWYLPKGAAPSTHIVKQSHVRLDAIVTNEQLSMLTAARCGIAVPHSFIINTGDGEDGEVLFATVRYDREMPPSGRTIQGLPCPLRLHQEDFAQALGIPAAAKYEHAPEQHLRRMFDLLRRASADPITDQLKLWDAVIFDYLIGNTDAHVKNFSLLYGRDLKTLRLAPIYDIVSTTVYKASTRDMAFRIGTAYSIDEINESAFRAAAKEVGLGTTIAMQHFAQMRKRFPAALHEAAELLAEQGFKKALSLEKSILESGGIAGAYRT